MLDNDCYLVLMKFHPYHNLSHGAYQIINIWPISLTTKDSMFFLYNSETKSIEISN